VALATPLRRVAIASGAGRVRTVESLDDRLARSIAPERLSVTLLGSLSAVALLLTTVGLYSLLAWTVTQRRRELGVRAALGADARRLRRMVLLQALRIAAVGTACGALGGLAAARAGRAVLFGIEPYDPLNLLLPAAVLLGCAAMAAWWPARRATRVDPMTVLRA